MTKPVRIQRSRRKGAKMVSPNGLPVVYVGRPSKWGNPFRVEQDESGQWWVADCWGITRFKSADEVWARMSAVNLFKVYLDNGGTAPGQIRDSGGAFIKQLAREELLGKNLACFCRLDQVCHADVLLELANKE